MIISKGHLHLHLAICCLLLVVNMVSSHVFADIKAKLGITKAIVEEAEKNHGSNVIFKLHKTGRALYKRSKDETEDKENLREKLNAILGEKEGPKYLMEFEASFEEFKEEIKQNGINRLLPLLSLQNEEEIESELKKFRKIDHSLFGDIKLLGELYKITFQISEEGKKLTAKTKENAAQIENIQGIKETKAWKALDVFNNANGAKFKELFQIFFKTVIKYEKLLDAHFNEFGVTANEVYGKIEHFFNPYSNLDGIEGNKHNEHIIEEARSMINVLKSEEGLPALKKMIPEKTDAGYKSNRKLTVISLIKKEFYAKADQLQKEIEELIKKVKMLNGDKVEYAAYVQLTTSTLKSLENEVEARVYEVAGFKANSHNEHTFKKANQLGRELNNDLVVMKELVPVQPDADDLVAEVRATRKGFEDRSEKMINKLEELEKIIDLLKRDKEFGEKIQQIKDLYKGQHGKHIADAEGSAINALLQEQIVRAKFEKEFLNSERENLLAEEGEAETEKRGLLDFLHKLETAREKIAGTKDGFDNEFSSPDEGNLLEVKDALGKAKDAIVEAVKQQNKKISDEKANIANLTEAMNTKNKEIADQNVFEGELIEALKAKEDLDMQVRNILEMKRDLHKGEPDEPGHAQSHGVSPLSKHSDAAGAKAAPPHHGRSWTHQGHERWTPL